jgi:nucleoside-diphosphate-sugar epimerase
MPTAPAITGLEDDVVAIDLEQMLRALEAEFAEMAGGSLLITGGAGFLGYYLVQAVLAWNRRQDVARQVQLTVYDNYIRGVPPWLTALQDEPTLTLVRYDVIRPLPADMPAFDYIVHAAGIASPRYYRLHPLETMDANINGLRSLLEHARQRQDTDRPVKGMLFFSSSEIYGDPDPAHIPTAEDYRGYVSCTGPRACYDESKRYGETLCVVFAQQYGVPVKVARPFNNYGPGLKISDRRVIPDFARDVLASRPIVMHSSGTPSRTFCYAADAVVGYLKVLVRGRAGEAYNIGTESPEVRMAVLAERVVAVGRDLLGYDGAVVRQPSDEEDYLVDNPQRRCPSIAKARAELGYAPAIGLDEGLRRSLVWYHQNPHAEDA